MTAPDPIPQDVALDLQLAAIAGASSGTYYELRHRTAGRMRQQFFPVEDRARAARAIRNAAEFGDAYIGAAPRARQDGSGDAVEQGWCLWADLDRPDAAQALDGFAPPPSIVVATGTAGHLHGWWALSRPVTPDRLEAANRRLAHTLDADARSTDRARILRPAGTRNHKHAPPAPVLCTVLEPERCYRVEQVASRLPDPPAECAQPTAAPVRVRDLGDDPLRAIPAVEYLARLTGLTVPRSQMVRCPLPGHEDRTPSFHVGGRDELSWLCHGCGRGGGIYELAAHLSGLAVPIRGRDFTAVRDALLEQLAPGKAA